MVSGGREGIFLCNSDFYLEVSMEVTTEPGNTRGRIGFEKVMLRLVLFLLNLIGQKISMLKIFYKELGILVLKFRSMLELKIIKI